MGARKRLAAEERKEKNRNLCMARLVDNKTSPRKTRLMADLVRGKGIEDALNILKYSKKESSEKIRKLILSAIANWQTKHETVRVEDSDLYIKEIFVDGGTMLKRLRSAPKGMGHRIRKRSNHITVLLDSKSNAEIEEEIQDIEDVQAVEKVQEVQEVEKVQEVEEVQDVEKVQAVEEKKRVRKKQKVQEVKEEVQEEEVVEEEKVQEIEEENNVNQTEE
jgi:large subunit ribosomal protein L22